MVGVFVDSFLCFGCKICDLKTCEKMTNMRHVNGQVEEINDAYKDILEEMGEWE